MNSADMHGKAERLISPYIDDELTQEEAQFVEIHLADCAECARAVREMKALRQMTASAPFPDGADERLDALGRSFSVQAPRSTGWLLVCVGLLAWLVWAGAAALRNLRVPTPQEAIAGLVFAGVVLLFVSVLRQRMLEYPHDRYRRVKR